MENLSLRPLQFAILNVQFILRMFPPGHRGSTSRIIMAPLLLGCHLHDKCKAGEQLFPSTFPYIHSHGVEVTHKFPALLRQKIWTTCAVFHPIPPTAAFSCRLVTQSVSHLQIWTATKRWILCDTAPWMEIPVCEAPYTLWCSTEIPPHFAYSCTHSNINRRFFPWIELIVCTIKCKIIKIIC